MKEFIEIPFGAKDSELCGWEYTIPKGYTANIENGKIVVKKEESEDERIRKRLIEEMRHFQREAAKESCDADFDFAKSAIAWLEKQGKQKSQRMISAEAKEVLYCKPAWSEKDEETLSRIRVIVKNDDLSRVEDILWLKSLKERLKGE